MCFEFEHELGNTIYKYPDPFGCRTGFTYSRLFKYTQQHTEGLKENNGVRIS